MILQANTVFRKNISALYHLTGYSFYALLLWIALSCRFTAGNTQIFLYSTLTNT
ncbi:MAG: hypothetical protein OFPI_35530 [Osedax symbiont Rs2]|nr:MAG: hypothetical protein OFPI_35530 [Osedax symbiont Rs2]